ASGSNSISINNGSLIVTNSAGPIANLSLTNATLQFSLANGLTNLVAGTLTTGGVSNRIDIASLPIAGPFPAQYTLIKYSGPIGGAGYNFVLGTMPLGQFCSGYLSNNVTNSSLDLVVVNCGVADTFLTWNGDISGDWDTETPNWKNNLVLG